MRLLSRVGWLWSQKAYNTASRDYFAVATCFTSYNCELNKVISLSFFQTGPSFTLNACSRWTTRWYSSAHNVHDTTAAPLPLLVIQPRVRGHENKLEEAVALASSARETAASPPHILVQDPGGRGKGKSGYYFGKGTVSEVADTLQSNFANQIRGVFVNSSLTGVQQRNLEQAWHPHAVIDRVGLILDIFKQRARTREAVLQVELADLQYLGSRLVRARAGKEGRGGFGAHGEIQVVSAKGRSGGRGGVSGGMGAGGGEGESELQLQQRRIKEKRAKLKLQLKKVQKTRGLQQRSRERASIARVALVGYTNSGKTTLLRALSKDRNLIPEDRLFATLDPTLRRVILPGTASFVVMSDTVGFIEDLPHQLVEAFRSTLEEVVHADILLHVMDAGSPTVMAQRKTVYQVLRSLGLQPEDMETKVVEVWNKVDTMVEWQPPEDVSTHHAAISALKERGFDDLLTTIQELLPSGTPPEEHEEGRLTARACAPENE